MDIQKEVPKLETLGDSQDIIGLKIGNLGQGGLKKLEIWDYVSYRWPRNDKKRFPNRSKVPHHPSHRAQKCPKIKI